MAGTVVESEADLKDKIGRDKLASEIALMWQSWDTSRSEWKDSQVEMRKYIFATDTKKTQNNTLPWKNNTTLPKICQIRDNLHANYISAIFPNEDWLIWEGYTQDDAEKKKRDTIQYYMGNKTREAQFYNVVSDLVYDFIDGNCFGDVEYRREVHKDERTGADIVDFVGPVPVRISPYDIVFNPLAASFKDSPNIVRSFKSLGELLWEAENKPEMKYNLEIVKKSKETRKFLTGFQADQIHKALGFQIDGFGQLTDYFNSEMVEILEFEGNIYDSIKGELRQGRVITVIDRCYVLRDEPIPNWTGKTSKFHVGWRKRTDTLWAMGACENLVGLQYRLDHLENLKADVFDQIAFPVRVRKGNVEEYKWAPGIDIECGEDGDVKYLVPDATALQADLQIERIMQIMEDMAGAPRMMMGIRTPGEKTAFEVESLQNASSRIFQEKITYFEKNGLEVMMNSMLEKARRNLDTIDIIRISDADLGVDRFMEITREDITAKGKLRPVGARHYALRNKMVQELSQYLEIGRRDPAVGNHISGRATAKLIEDLLGFRRFSLVSPYVRLKEQAESEVYARNAMQEVTKTAPPIPEDYRQMMGMQEQPAAAPPTMGGIPMGGIE